MFNKQHPSLAVAPAVSQEEAHSKTYDAVIVGSGISGSILAHELTSKGYRVLILEASPGRDLSQHGFQKYLENFYAATTKDNNSPFPLNPNAEMPRGRRPFLKQLAPGETNPNAYWVQTGPFVSDSVYTRVLGGTTVHWEAKTPRMLREDFKLRTNFGQGLDWPFGLDKLMPYYEKAEYVLGVSGDVEAQKKVGVEYRKNYVYPMSELKASYLDQIVAGGLQGMQAEIEGEKIDLDIITFPQAKNSSPNPDYGKKIKLPFLSKDGLPFRPVGAISLHQDEEGERCQGNTNCVPLCPVQAKFDARKLLVRALNTGLADLLTQAVASRVVIDDSSQVTGIEVKCYENRDLPDHKTILVKGKVFILAANAVENARLMLASEILNKRPVNKFIGRHLMDHHYLLCWGQLPAAAGVGRGPSCTSGLCNFRRGKFRHKMASFAADIHNDGWGWATGAPITDLIDAVDNGKLYGRALREELIKRISGQLLLAYMIEMPADPESRVTVNQQYKDQLGNMKPVIHFKLSDYSLRMVEYTYDLSAKIFKKLGAKNHTKYDPQNYGYLEYNNRGYEIRGGNHLAGTHIMGTHSSNSVVNSDQRSWEHDNLYLIGPGSMPSIGSSNTTLTIAALCFKTAKAVLKVL